MPLSCLGLPLDVCPNAVVNEILAHLHNLRIRKCIFSSSPNKISSYRLRLYIVRILSVVLLTLGAWSRIPSRLVNDDAAKLTRQSSRPLPDFAAATTIGMLTDMLKRRPL